jgi:hypothetical protein
VASDAEEKKPVKVDLHAGRLREPAGLAVLVGLAGLLIAGPVGAGVGLTAGAVAARRPSIVFLAGAVALGAAVLFTLIEDPLTEAQIPSFPGDHPLAELAGMVAGVLLLGGLAGIATQLERIPPVRETVPGPDPKAQEPAPIASILAATLLGAVVLLWVADERWHAVALVLIAAVIAVAVVLVSRQWRPFARGR